MRLMVAAMNRGAIGVAEKTQRSMPPRPNRSLSLELTSLNAFY